MSDTTDNLRRGWFVTFEGPEGAGKTTHAKILAQRLEALGAETLLTREPGGDVVAEKIRALLKDPALNRVIGVRAEALLIQAARAQHALNVVKPALAAGKVVICDRFADSSVAYQGYGRHLDAALVATLNAFSTEGLVPDITFLMDLPPEDGLRRAERRGDGAPKDRFEDEGLDFHRAVRQGFLDIARAEPGRVKQLDATAPKDRVAQQIYGHFHELLRRTR